MEDLRAANSKEVSELKRLVAIANESVLSHQKIKSEDDIQISRLKVQLQAAKTLSERNEGKISELMNKINELELMLESASHTDSTDLLQKELAIKDSMIKSLQKQLEEALGNVNNITVKFNHLDMLHKSAVSESQKIQADYTGLNALYNPLKAKSDDYELKLKVLTHSLVLAYLLTHLLTHSLAGLRERQVELTEYGGGRATRVE
jgi:chromosome segregation ATPase